MDSGASVSIPWGAFSVATGGWLLFALVSFLVIRAMVRGSLVPRSTLEDSIHETNEWRAESRIKDTQIALKDEQLATKDKQLDHLAEVGETQKALLHALGKLAGQEPE